MRAAPRSRPRKGIFPIVGIGASAGGLEALSGFFDAVPADSGMAFVVVQHLDPTHESLTAQLLSRHTRMRVIEVNRKTVVRPERVYVIPPNRYLSIADGVLHPSVPAQARGARTAIDFFLVSLARDLHRRAVAVILSGSGADGSLGVKAVKAAGGLVLVQDPSTAQHAGMPSNAIATRQADFVLPVAALPRHLVRAAHASRSAVPVEASPRDPSEAIVALLHRHARIDFAAYRKATLQRRIQRRMRLRRAATLADYLRLLREEPEEIEALHSDLLITVTSFFRDAAAWGEVVKKVIRPLAEDGDREMPLRVWVAGCATGEEAYSIGMLFLEQAALESSSRGVQIFASDVSEQALETARIGVYPERIASSVSAERLRRFFVKEGRRYRVRRELRELVTFARQNLIGDPPFSRIDLVTCRNVLIYLEPAVQQKVLGLLHFALRPGGYLFLGKAESTSRQQDLFEPVSRKYRIYRRVGMVRHDAIPFGWSLRPGGPVVGGSGAAAPARIAPDRVADLARQLLLQRFAPASVLIDDRGEILFFWGPTERYLTQPSGLPTQDLVGKVPRVAQVRLRGALAEATREERPVILPAVPFGSGPEAHRVSIRVEPLKVNGSPEARLLVTFEEEQTRTFAGAEAADAGAAGAEGAETSAVRQLEHDLETNREELHRALEEMEAANKELTLANQEILSVNEELQSTNEELETSKEELQSLNEELSTVNSQLEGKVAELEQSNNDLDNMLASSSIALIFLDRRLKIRRFTQAATKLFRLIPSDLGRSLSDIVPRFTDPALLADARKALTVMAPSQAEVRTTENRWYIRDVRPYRTRDGRVDGAVLTFSDVASAAVQESRLLSEAVLDTVRDGLLVLDPDLRVRFVNHSMVELLRSSRARVTGRHIRDLMQGRDWKAPGLLARLRLALTSQRPFDRQRLQISGAGRGRARAVVVDAVAVQRGKGRAPFLLVTVHDETAERQRSEAMHDREALLGSIVQTAADGIITIDETGRILSFNAAAERMFGYAGKEILGRNVKVLMPPGDGGAHGAALARRLRLAPESGGSSRRRGLGKRKDRTTFPVEISVSEFKDGPVRKFTGLVRDRTELERAEREAVTRRDELGRVLRIASIGELAGGLSHELTQPLTAIASDVAVALKQLRAGQGGKPAAIKVLEHAAAQTLRAGDIIRAATRFVESREPEPVECDLNDVVRAAADLMGPELRRTGISLRSEIPSRATPVHADVTQIEQVLVNLLQNAIDSVAGEGTRSGEVRIVVARSTGGLARVSVHDTGPGLTREAREKLFTSFFTTKKRGLGMGLAISRSIVESHGGKLELDDRAGGKRGATASFTLPLSAGRIARRRAR